MPELIITAANCEHLLAPAQRDVCVPRSSPGGGNADCRHSVPDLER